MPLAARLLTCLLFFSAACALGRNAAPAPVSVEASEALAEARRLVRSGAEPDDPALRDVLLRAHELEPDWVAPLRLADNLALEQLLGPSLLDERREGLQSAPGDPVLHYLTGRLEGRAGGYRFEYAANLDPASAWAHHGRAYTASQRSGTSDAIRLERRALELARDPWESAFFRVSLARYYQLAARFEDAVELMREPRARVGLRPGDRAWYELETALVELRQLEVGTAAHGHRRGIELLRRVDFSPADLERLVRELTLNVAGLDPTGRELQLALAARPGEAREDLRARVAVLRQGDGLALALSERSVVEGAVQIPRAVWFRSGHFREGVEDWLASCPQQVLTDDGLPLDDHLRDVVETARALGPAGGGESVEGLRDFGDALLRAGWFGEAAQVAGKLGALDLDAGLALNDRALAGSLCVDRIVERLAPREEDPPAFFDPLAGPVEQRFDVDSLDEVGRGPDRLERWLSDLSPVFVQVHEALGGETDLDRVRDAMIASPRLSYGPIGQLLHPGARFSASDQRAGLGAEGDPVPGIADEFARLGRFAIVGTLVGRGLDGMLLRRLALEKRAGEHLGVPWHGTIAWCEGLDTGGVNGGAGVRISGAALHEGYWIDVQTVRADLARWRKLDRTFDEPGGQARVDRALATRGIALAVPTSNPDARARERRAIRPSLGQSQRVRLAVLQDRRELGQPGVELEELVETVAVHEEGHLCDRTRFLPVHKKLGPALFLLLDNGFSPDAIQVRLEYRAQLTALCCVTEPRIVFAEVIESAEAMRDGPLPHARAYRKLLADLLEVLDQDRGREPTHWPTLDGQRMLMHQLHRLSGEEVRALGRKLARREGMISG